MIVRKSGKICLTEKDPSKKTFLDGIGTIMQTENEKRRLKVKYWGEGKERKKSVIK